MNKHNTVRKMAENKSVYVLNAVSFRVKIRIKKSFIYICQIVNIVFRQLVP